jgi:hypothetical protein
MTDELERICKEVVMGESSYYRSVWLQGLGKTTKSSRIMGVPTDIRTEHLTDATPTRAATPSALGAIAVASYVERNDWTKMEPLPVIEPRPT